MPRATHASPPLVIGKADLRGVIGISARQAERLESEGRFPARVQLSDRRVGWRYADIVAWVEARTVAAAGGPR